MVALASRERPAVPASLSTATLRAVTPADRNYTRARERTSRRLASHCSILQNFILLHKYLLFSPRETTIFKIIRLHFHQIIFSPVLDPESPPTHTNKSIRRKSLLHYVVSLLRRAGIFINNFKNRILNIYKSIYLNFIDKRACNCLMLFVIVYIAYYI